MQEIHISPIATLLINFKVCINILFIVKVIYLWTIHIAHFMLTIASKKSTNFENCWQYISNMVYWCPFLHSHPIIHHWNTRDACVNLVIPLIKCVYLVGMWFGGDEWTNTDRHLRKRNWTNTSIEYSKLDSGHNWEGLCSHLGNQQPCTSDIHNYIMGGLIFNPILVDIL